MCDRYGFLVMDEAFDEWSGSKRKWIFGRNIGQPSLHGGYSEFFNKWAEADMLDMVLRDRTGRTEPSNRARNRIANRELRTENWNCPADQFPHGRSPGRRSHGSPLPRRRHLPDRSPPNQPGPVWSWHRPHPLNDQHFLPQPRRGATGSKHRRRPGPLRAGPKKKGAPSAKPAGLASSSSRPK